MDTRLRRIVAVILPMSVVIGLVYAAVWGDDGLWRRHRMQMDLERAQRRLASVEAENAKLAREVEQLRHDDVTVRRAVAEELLLVPPGSTVVRFR
jgi:cell division protein FtsB